MPRPEFSLYVDNLVDIVYLYLKFSFTQNCSAHVSK